MFLWHKFGAVSDLLEAGMYEVLNCQKSIVVAGSEFSAVRHLLVLLGDSNQE